jgi:maltose-binding protein MalE
MAKRSFVLLASFALLVVACGGTGASTAPSVNAPTSAATLPAASHAATPPAGTTAPTAGETMSAQSPGESAATSPGASEVASVTPPPPCNATAGQASSSGGSFDPSSVTGSAELGHWDSSPAENAALDCALQGFALTYPNVQVTNTDVAGDYAAQMVTRFGAHTPPDVFYVNGDTALDWETQGFLLPLDDYIQNSGFDMSNFFPGYQDTFKGADGKTYGVAKDGNTIAMAYNKDLVPNPPKTLDELKQVATSLKGQSGLQAPMCLNEGLDRGLAFLYAQGGSLVSDDNKTVSG